MHLPSSTHLLLIPSYNTGNTVLNVVKEALENWQPVWVIVDGSNDGSAEALSRLAKVRPMLTVIQLPTNQGKGAAVYAGLSNAAAQGFSHVLIMDADGQHPAAFIQTFMATSLKNPRAMVLGDPVFDKTAPAIRVKGRKISNFWVNLETLWAGIDDSLFGFRIYPVHDLLAVMAATKFARRFDFDPEVVVRLAWRGLAIINKPVPVRYFSAAEGGVSQFRYLRDNLLLTWMHSRLVCGSLFRLPLLIWRRLRAGDLDNR